jgi:16S rRNA processing protein RimM
MSIEDINWEDGTWILIAAITAAHSLDGSVKLKLFGNDKTNLKRYKIFTTNRNTALALKSVRMQSGVAIARFNEINDRTAAEQARGTKLYVARTALPAASDDEIYHIDLIGMSVATPDAVTVGTVIDVVNYGAGDLLDIQRSNGQTILIPYRDVAVLETDRAAKHIIIDPAFLD